MTQTLIAGLYIIKYDEDGKLLIFLPQPEGNKEKPVIMYDGGAHALLVRNRGQKIILDNVSPDIRSDFRSAYKAIVVEVSGSEIVDHYEVLVHHPEKISVNWQLYGL